MACSTGVLDAPPVSKLLDHVIFVSHDDDGRDEEDHADRVFGVKTSVLEVKLQDEVQDHLEAAENVGLAGADPPRDREGETRPRQKSRGQKKAPT